MYIYTHSQHVYIYILGTHIPGIPSILNTKNVTLHDTTHPHVAMPVLFFSDRVHLVIFENQT